ncbi:hypothetical protein [Rehaibacterium terrae]|uniref:hypothetical protein n=1 Tax=Rehaibacterium terrae TaxID=1341696 RepID=UPI003919807B
MSLRRKLAEHGFESNDDYEHALRCLFAQDDGGLRVLHVDGEAGRRKTAFAHALGRALDYPHVLYHDFSDAEPAPIALPVVLEDGTPGPAEPPLSAFERTMTEACAYSEAEPVMLILDQLQAAPFAEHVRLYRFACEREWRNAAGAVMANPRHFLLVLISEQPLYHSLAKRAFRVWTDALRAWQDYRPEDYGLGRQAQPLFDALGRAFQALGAAPTPSEFGRLLDDLLHRVGSEEQLRQSLFGRMESIDRARLYGPELLAPLRAVLAESERLLGAEHVELRGED